MRQLSFRRDHRTRPTSGKTGEKRSLYFLGAGGTDGVPLLLRRGHAQVNGSSIRMGTFGHASRKRALDRSQSVGSRIPSVFASPTAEAMGHPSETAADGVRVNGVDHRRPVRAHPDVSYRPVLPFCCFFRRLVWRSDLSSPTARRTAFARRAAFAFVPPIRERLRAVAIFLLSLGIFASCRAVFRCLTIPPPYRIGGASVTVTVGLPPVDAGSRARGPSRGGIRDARLDRAAPCGRMTIEVAVNDQDDPYHYGPEVAFEISHRITNRVQ